MKNTKTSNILGEKYEIDMNNPVLRFVNNPILTSHEVNKVWQKPDLKVTTVHNAGITQYNGKVIMLFRSHLRNGVSIIGLATSENGFTNWEIQSEPFLKPCTVDDKHSGKYTILELIENEAGGVEDTRISKIGDIYYITYSAYHSEIQDKVRVSLASTNDFKTITRLGPVLDLDMRNVVIFPEKINNKYLALFRPNDNTENVTGGKFSEILLGYSDKLSDNRWELAKEKVMGQTGAPSAFSDKIGPGATPIKTKYGWLNIFHGVRKTMDGNPYTLGVAMHDLENPAKVKVSNIPILFPSAADCKVKSEDYVHVPNVVFTCGALRLSDGRILIYYGGNDTVMNIGISHEDILNELCEKYPQDAKTGRKI